MTLNQLRTVSREFTNRVLTAPGPGGGRGRTRRADRSRAGGHCEDAGVKTQDDLATLLRSLAVGHRVHAGCGPSASVPIAERVLELAGQTHHDRPVERRTGPTSAAEVAAALDPISRWEAVEVMADMAAVDLVSRQWLQEKDGTHQAATRVAEILGEEATWVTNWEGYWGAGGQWSPVTHHDIDVIVAGANDEIFAVLLAFGDD